ncbi:MAG: DUF2934 domain-containing protein [Steroidobacteraceae bacterium]
MEAAATSPIPTASLKRVAPKSKTSLTAVARKPAVRKAKTIVKDLPEIVDITAMIAEAAYLIAASRGFTPGHDVEDWLQAEQQILSRFR